MADTVTWIDKAGNSHAFDDSVNQLALEGPLGRYFPPVKIVELERPLQPGSTIQQVKILPRDVTLPLLSSASSASNETAAERNLATWLHPGADGILRMLRPDGSTRDLNCRYQGGYEGKETRDVAGGTWMAMALGFRATDPFLYDQNFTAPTFTTWAGNISIVLSGDWDTWPIWTLHGPGSAFSMTVTYPDGTTKTLALTLTLLSTDQSTITGPRAADGSIPSSNYLVPANGAAVGAKI